MLAALVLILTGFGGISASASEKQRFSKFRQIYEPSGVQQLPDGRFIVVQDESSHPFDLFVLQQDGKVEETPLYRRSSFSWASANRALNNFEDLEGVASDNDGYIYAITSHSRKASGKRDDAREQLARFRLDAEQSREVQSIHGLHKLITAKYPALKRSVKIRDVNKDGWFNVEGLSFDAQKQQLLIGLRGPLSALNQAIIVILENPGALFDTAEAPRFADQLIRLELQGGGIRGLAYDPYLGGYLIISARPGKSFKLWFWDGGRDSKPKRVAIKGLKTLRQAEGVTPVQFDGRPQGILLVSDDGDGITKKVGRYLFISYQQLSLK